MSKPTYDRSKLRVNKTLSGLTNDVKNVDEPPSVTDNIWSEEYNDHTYALNQLESRLSKHKRKVYEIERVLAQNVESTTVLLALLHNLIDEF